jgi:hypothetical protein
MCPLVGFYAGLNLIAWGMIFCFVRETKQLTLEEIDRTSTFVSYHAHNYSNHVVQRSSPSLRSSSSATNQRSGYHTSSSAISSVATSRSRHQSSKRSTVTRSSLFFRLQGAVSWYTRRNAKTERPYAWHAHYDQRLPHRLNTSRIDNECIRCDDRSRHSLVMSRRKFASVTLPHVISFLQTPSYFGCVGWQCRSTCSRRSRNVPRVFCEDLFESSFVLDR